MKVKATISVRMRSGRFPKGSFATELLALREQVRRDITEAFDRQRDPQTGRQWKPSPWISRPLLVKSGRMKQRAIEAAASATVIGGNTLQVSARLPYYARFQNSGTRLIPKRRFVAISAKTRKVLARKLKNKALRLWRGAA